MVHPYSNPYKKLQSDAHTNVILPVREHFCSPLLQFEAEDKDSTFTLIECPSTLPPSSPMLWVVVLIQKSRWYRPADLPSHERRDRYRNVCSAPHPISTNDDWLTAFRDRALTDPLIAGIAKGSEAYKLVGSYVTSPLRWCVPLAIVR
jgi:hypothetical protein